MPAKRGERKETNDKKTLLISLLIGSALGVAIFFILLSIASAVMLKKGVSSGAYTPVSIVCRNSGVYSRTIFCHPDKKKRTSVGTVFIRFAHCLRCCIRRGRRRQCRHKNSDCVGGCGRMCLCRRYTCRKYEKENTMTVPQGTVLSCKI